MPTRLTPCSSGEIVCISPPPPDSRSKVGASSNKRRRIESPQVRAPLGSKINGITPTRYVRDNVYATVPSICPGGSGSQSSGRIAAKAELDVGARDREVITIDDEEEGIDSKVPPLQIKREQAEYTYDASAATTLARPRGFSPTIELKDAAYRARNAYDAKEAVQTGKRKIRKQDVRKAGQDMVDMPREAVTAKMMSTLGKDSNPITNSDLYTRTDHFVSAATGHQVSNRGGGSSGAATYWQVRTAKMEEQAREKKSDLFRGLVFYINGSTGPRASNLQVQHLITSHGGRFVPMQSSSCTHILAQNLSGSKTQKWIDGQAGRGGAKRTKIVSVDWLLDSAEKGVRLSEVPYSVIHNPSQHSILSALAPKPKS